MKNKVVFILSLLIAGLNGNLFLLQAEDIKTLEIGAQRPHFHCRVWMEKPIRLKALRNRKF